MIFKHGEQQRLKQQTTTYTNNDDNNSYRNVGVRWKNVKAERGLSLYLESGSGNKLSSYVKQYIQNLLKVNMEEVYGPKWPTEEKVKRREMVSPEARYIFVRAAPDAGVGVLGLDERRLVGFVQFRFTLEEELPVLYVYEIQLERRVQGKGLGDFLMQLIVLIAPKSCMSAVVLTVQKANVAAVNFYTSKLRNLHRLQLAPLKST